MKHVKKPSKIYYKMINLCWCTLFSIQQQLKKRDLFIFLAQLDAEKRAITTSKHGDSIPTVGD